MSKRPSTALALPSTLEHLHFLERFESEYAPDLCHLRPVCLCVKVFVDIRFSVVFPFFISLSPFLVRYYDTVAQCPESLCMALYGFATILGLRLVARRGSQASRPSLRSEVGASAFAYGDSD